MGIMTSPIPDEHPDSHPPETSHWLECNSPSKCDGVYEFRDDKFVCNKCGNVMKAEVSADRSKIRFGGITSYNGIPSFNMHFIPGDRAIITKEFRHGLSFEDSAMDRTQMKLFKEFKTFEMGGKKVKKITINFILDMEIELE
jgi:hypothetical protein